MDFKLVVAATFFALAGCGAKSSAVQNNRETIAGNASGENNEPETIACSGSVEHSDLSDKKRDTQNKETRYFVLDTQSQKLSTWNNELGGVVSVCRGWGEGCYTEVFPLKIKTKAALSADETLSIDLFRDKGIVFVDEKHFDELSIFVGKCHKGQLPSVNIAHRAV